jgi:hypothetical protein
VGVIVEIVGGPAQEETTVQDVAHPVGHAVGQDAYTVSIAVRVQQLSVAHGCVMVESCRQAGRRHVAVLKLHEDHGAGMSTCVLKEGQ